ARFSRKNCSGKYAMVVSFARVALSAVIVDFLNVLWDLVGSATPLGWGLCGSGYVEHGQRRAHTVVGADEGRHVDQTLSTEGFFSFGVKCVVDPVIEAELPGHTSGNLFFVAELVGYFSVGQCLDGVLGDARRVGGSGVGIELVVGAPHGADGQDYHLAYPLVQRGVQRLEQLQLDELRRNRRAVQCRVKWADEASIVGGGLDVDVFGPGDQCVRQQVE